MTDTDLLAEARHAFEAGSLRHAEQLPLTRRDEKDLGSCVQKPTLTQGGPG
jgi:hypothetical protein